MAAIQRSIEPIYAGGGTVLFVQLTCHPDAWRGRVPNESRRALGKLTDPERALGLFTGGDPFTTMPMEPTLRIDTTHLAPTEAAARIAAHYSLPIIDGDQCPLPQPSGSAT